MTVYSHADSSFPSEQELEELVDDALLVRSIMGGRRYPWDYENIEPALEVTEEKNGVVFKYIYRPALEGLDADGIKEFVRRTLTGKYAEEVLNRNASFFDDFRYIDGKLYFREWGYTLLHGYKDYRRDESKDIIVVEKTDEKAVIDVSFLPDTDGRQDVTVRLFLAKENGAWKISAYDNKNMLLTGDAEKMKQEALSREMAAEAVKAVIMEGYYYTSLNGKDTDTLYELDSPYDILEGTLAYPDTWKEYLAGFCTSGVAEQILFKNSALKLRSDGLLERTGTGCEISLYSSIHGFNADRLTITKAGDNAATCEYLLGHGDKEICMLTIEFSKTDTGWRISGGDFAEKIQAKYYSGVNPSTSDTGFGIFAVLTAAAAALTAVMKKKKYVS